MMTRNKSTQKKKLLIGLIIPISAFLLLSFSYISCSNGNVTSDRKGDTGLFEKQLIVGEINWVGNTKYSDRKLTKALWLKRGDPITLDEIERACFVDDFISLYADHGYANFTWDIATTVRNGTVDLTISIVEDKKAFFGEIFVEGNTLIPTEDILERISVKPGDLFNWSKVRESARVIEAMYKPNSVDVVNKAVFSMDNSFPEYDAPDVVFEVTEKK